MTLSLTYAMNKSNAFWISESIY